MKYSEFKAISRIVKRNARKAQSGFRVETESPHDAQGNSKPVIIRFSLEDKRHA